MILTDFPITILQLEDILDLTLMKPLFHIFGFWTSVKFIFEMGITVKKRICKKIKDLRIEKGYSQFELAEVLHMSQNAYSELESGKRKLDIERLTAIAQVFKIKLSVLIEEK